MSRLEILHLNDVHGHYQRYARAVARVREIRAAADHPTLFFDGGDIEEASVEVSALSYGVVGWRLLRAAGVDAATVGNGGLLRYGPDVLASYADALGHPPVLCNLTRDGALLPGVRAYRLLRAGGLTVGVIGATDPFPVYDAFGLDEQPLYRSVRQFATQARAEGADVVVLLSHLGMYLDLAATFHLRSYVDLIVGGHSHHALADGNNEAFLPVAQAGAHAEFLGRIVLRLDGGRSGDGVEVESMTLEPVESDGPADEPVLAELRAAEADLQAWLDEPVAELARPVGFDPQTGGEIGRLLVCALLADQPGDVGVLFPAHCQTGLPAGVITRRMVWAVTRSPANPTTATLSGEQLAALLRRGASAASATATPRSFRGRALGALVVIGAELRDGQAYVDGRPVDDAADYRVTGSDSELTSFGELLDPPPSDVTVHTPAILPELLEAHLSRGRSAQFDAELRLGGPAAVVAPTRRRGSCQDAWMTVFDVHRPLRGDVIDLILADHYLIEHLLRQLRNAAIDRDAARQAFAAVHVAHAEAEERHVYPVLQRRSHEVNSDEAEHGQQEHAIGNHALLKVLELKSTSTQAYDEAVKQLSALVCHHLAEEELTILNPAREDVPDRVRHELGIKFAAERNRQVDAGCGSVANLRKIVAAAEREGLLEDEDEELQEAEGKG